MEHVRCRHLGSGIPLGGLGAGSVELRDDGWLHEWHIFNNAPWGAGPATGLMEEDGLYFGLAVAPERDRARAMILGLPRSYHPRLNDPYAMPWVEHPRSVAWRGRFPQVRLRYDTGEDFPVTVEMTAFSPFIPLDAKNSALPAALFLFRLHNRRSVPVRVSLFGALRNAVLYDAPSGAPEMYFNGCGIVMSRASEDVRRSSFGSLCLCTAAGDVSHAWDWVKERQVWEPLMEEGRVAPPERRKGETFPYGLLAVRREMRPGEEVEVPMVLTWFFPNHYERAGACRGKEARNIGHKYAEWFADAEEAGSYVLENFTYLRTETEEFLETFYSSDCEEWLLDAVNAQLTTLFTSSWWDREGRFGIWEGLGCCGLQTMDISFYGSFPVVLFFPELEKSQMRLSLANRKGDGRVPHLMPGAFSCCDADERNRIDLMPQFVLLAFRDMLWTADRSWVQEMYPAVKEALEAMKKTDTDGDGLPNNRGTDQTYDQFPMYGTTAYVGLLYIASLAAAAEMAEYMGEPEQADVYRRESASLLEVYEKELFNGEYYNVYHDPAGGVTNTGCMLDQLAGEWFLRMTGRKGLLPPERVERVLESIHRLNRSPHGFWMNCAWPREEERLRIPLHVTDQVAAPWSGVEYAAAALFVSAGMTERGLEVARDAWNRYERTGLRYNHIECGEHYYRAMSAWCILLALQGFGFDARRGRIWFAASARPRSFLFNTPSSWGRVSLPAREEGVFTLEVLRGELRLSGVSLYNHEGVVKEVLWNGAPVEVSVEAVEGGTGASWPEEIVLSMGSDLCMRTEKE